MSSVSTAYRNNLRAKDPEAYAKYLQTQKERAKRYRDERKKKFGKKKLTPAIREEREHLLELGRIRSQRYNDAKRERQGLAPPVRSGRGNPIKLAEMDEEQLRGHRATVRREWLAGLSNQKKSALRRRNAERMRQKRQKAREEKERRARLRLDLKTLMKSFPLKIRNLASELKLDLEELESLSKTAKRLKVQDYLAKEISRLTQEIGKLTTKSTASSSDKKDKALVYNENITNYAWDQSDKFTKIYLTLDQPLKDEDVETAYTEQSVKVTLRFQHKHCHLNIAKLYEDIKPIECYAKVSSKSGLVTVFLKKKSLKKTWTFLTEKEKDKDQLSKPNVDPEEDPGASLQKMLKQMYEGGDDEMKRTIAKAFHESQAKKGPGGAGGSGDPMAGLGDAFAGL